MPIVFVEAKDPGDGATVVVECRTREEALAAIQRFRAERLEGIRVTDRQGTIVPGIDI